MMEKIPETIIYLRTSKEEQYPEQQLKDCKSINEYGLYILYEEQQSAFKDEEREKFNEVLQLIKRRKIKHLICWDCDRLYRNRKKLVSFFKLCNIYKCKIHSFRQHWLEEINKMPEPFNEIMYNLMLNIIGWMAEEESTKKSERVKKAVRKKDGKTISYKGNIWGRKPVPKSVRENIIKLHEQGKNYREICDEIVYWDRMRNKKNVSIGFVHKIIKENKRIKYRK